MPAETVSAPSFSRLPRAVVLLGFTSLFTDVGTGNDLSAPARLSHGDAAGQPHLPRPHRRRGRYRLEPPEADVWDLRGPPRAPQTARPLRVRARERRASCRRSGHTPMARARGACDRPCRQGHPPISPRRVIADVAGHRRGARICISPSDGPRRCRDWACPPRRASSVCTSRCARSFSWFAILPRVSATTLVAAVREPPRDSASQRSAMSARSAPSPSVLSPALRSYLFILAFRSETPPMLFSFCARALSASPRPRSPSCGRC